MYGIDLFCGAGGLSLGAKHAGIDVRVAFDKDENACRTYRRNHPGTDCVTFDLRRFPVTPRFASGKLVIFGGPPCQGFSTSNQKTRNRDNPGNWLFRSYFKVICRLEPKFFVLENVTGILQTERGLFVEKIRAAARRAGYLTTLLDLDAQEFGIPQRRRRLFIVGHKKNLRLNLDDHKVKSPVTVREAIG